MRLVVVPAHRRQTFVASCKRRCSSNTSNGSNRLTRRPTSSSSCSANDEEKKGGLTHIAQESNLPTMVDVGGKTVTRRTAKAVSLVSLPPQVASLFLEAGAAASKFGEVSSPKGPVLATAIVAGTQAAKQTSQLIPFCHPLPLDKVKFDMSLERAVNDWATLRVECIVSVDHKTGVEMEALTGASVAALTVYDMCKALSHDIVIKETKLLSKTGGKSDYSIRK